MILRLSAQGAALAALIFAARFLMRRCAAQYRYALWLLLIARLLLPFELPSPSSAYNLLPKAPVSSASPLARSEPITQTAAIAPRAQPAPPTHAPVSGAAIILPDSVPPTPPPFDWRRAASIVWLTGSALMLAYMATVYTTAYSGARKRRNASDVAVSKGYAAPFVIGVHRPIIAIPAGLSSDALECVLAHERAHIQRFDHIAHLLGALALCVHWANPLVWLALRAMEADCEAACDDAVVRGRDAEWRKRYASALVECSARAIKRLPAPVLAFSSSGLRARIKAVLISKRYTTASALAALCVTAALIAVGCTSAFNASLGETPSPATPSPAAQTGATTAALASTPTSSHTSATPEPVLPINTTSTLAPLTYEGQTPVLPALTHWSYKRVGPAVFDLDAFAKRLWGDAPVEKRPHDRGTLYVLPDSPRGDFGEQLFLEAETGALSYEIIFEGSKFPGLQPVNGTREQATADMQAFIDVAVPEGAFEAVHAFTAGLDDNGKLVSYVGYWSQSIESVPLTEGYIETDITDIGVYRLHITWNELEPTDTPAPAAPLTAEQALYTFDYHRSTSDPGDYSLLRDCVRAGNARVVYTPVFNAENAVFSPAWEFQLSTINDKDVGYLAYVDIVTGDAYVSAITGFLLSPYTSRGHAPSVAREMAAAAAYQEEIAAFYPLVFAETDEYIYSIRPGRNTMNPRIGVLDRFIGSIWRFDKSTGREDELDSYARLQQGGKTVDTIRQSAFAAIVGDRIVFAGYRVDNLQDIKGNGRLVSIALDGSDRIDYSPKLNVFKSLCADAERVYYEGWPGNDNTTTSPLNYVTSDFKHDRHVRTLDKRLVCVRNGTVYGIDMDGKGRAVYKLVKDEWTLHTQLDFEASGVVPLLGQNTWKITGSDGQSTLFNPE